LAKTGPPENKLAQTDKAEPFHHQKKLQTHTKPKKLFKSKLPAKKKITEDVPKFFFSNITQQGPKHKKN
jgi:hypothetical protein